MVKERHQIEFHCVESQLISIRLSITNRYEKKLLAQKMHAVLLKIFKAGKMLSNLKIFIKLLFGSFYNVFFQF